MPSEAGRQQHHRAVDVYPSRVARLPMGFGDVRNGRKVVEGAGVHVAALDRHDGRTRPGTQGVREQVRTHPVLVVARDQDRGPLPQPEEAQRAQDRGVRTLLDDDAHRRCAEQPVRLGVPAGRAQHLVPGRGQAGEVRHLTARHEADRGCRWQTQQVDQPLGGDLFSDSHAGRRREQPRVLVPRRDQQLGTPGRRVQATDDETEEPTAGVRGDVRAEITDQVGHDLRRLQTLIWQPVVERSPDLGVLALRIHPTLRQRPQVAQRLGRGYIEHGLPV